MPGVRDRYELSAKAEQSIREATRLARMTCQISCAQQLAKWLRTLGEDLPPFSWSYER